jgi:ApbE superfamily uncharacterized protein (UPF0280 family)
MASVAGAMAEFVGLDIAPRSPQFILENGGDIFLKTDTERLSLIYAGPSPYSGKVAVRLKAAPDPYGICTSSATVGPSLSLGRADAVVIVASSSLLADGLATYVGNGVKKKSDIPRAIERGSRFPGVKGILVILGKELGAWGDIEIVRV